MILAATTRRTPGWLPALLLVLMVAVWLWLVLGRAQAELRITGPEEVILQGRESGCPLRHVPDGPPRAFRDGDGEVHLTISHHQAYRMTGPDLASLSLDCSPIFESDFEPEPSRFNDREWLSSVYALDGDQVVALVHMEYQGHQHRGRCPTRRYRDCWYNAVTLARSSDGGRSFGHTPPPRHLVASLPARYRPGRGPAGVFGPSNIVFREDDGFYYALVRMIPYGKTGRGVCLLRSRDPADPASWRAWDGEAFGHAFPNPYVTAQARATPCRPVSPAEIQTMSQSLTYNTEIDRFLLVGLSTRVDPQTRGRRTGFYYSLSKDLVDWTDRRLLLETGTPNSYECGDPDPRSYPSVIDPDSPTRNFETSDGDAYLYFVRFQMKDCRSTGFRDLVRVPIEVRRADW